MPEHDLSKLTVQQLKSLSALTLDNIHEVCDELNSLQERYKAIQEELKNRGA
jgi:hypothetical protein